MMEDAINDKTHCLSWPRRKV